MIILTKSGQLLLKAKYTKRWKGKDGKWRYEYKKEGATLNNKDLVSWFFDKLSIDREKATDKKNIDTGAEFRFAMMDKKEQINFAKKELVQLAQKEKMKPKDFLKKQINNFNKYKEEKEKQSKERIKKEKEKIEKLQVNKNVQKFIDEYKKGNNEFYIRFTDEPKEDLKRGYSVHNLGYDDDYSDEDIADIEGVDEDDLIFFDGIWHLKYEGISGHGHDDLINLKNIKELNGITKEIMKQGYTWQQPGDAYLFIGKMTDSDVPEGLAFEPKDYIKIY